MPHTFCGSSTENQIYQKLQSTSSANLLHPRDPHYPQSNTPSTPPWKFQFPGRDRKRFDGCSYEERETLCAVVLLNSLCWQQLFYLPRPSLEYECNICRFAAREITAFVIYFLHIEKEQFLIIELPMVLFYESPSFVIKIN